MEQDQSKTRGKGKQKEEANVQDSSSMLSRIAKSTTGLTDALLSGPPSTNILANTIAEKGSTSTAETGFHSQDSTQVQADISRGSGVPSSSQTNPSFKAQHAQDHVAEQEAAFSSFLDSTNAMPLQPSTAAGSRETHVNQEDNVTARDHPNHSSSDSYSSTIPDLAFQQSHDGDEVLDMLLNDTESFAVEMALEGFLLDEEQAQLRADLFPPTAPRPRQDLWDYALNFVPSFLRQSENGGLWTAREIESSFSLLGERDPDQAWRVWVGQWRYVLTQYTDEVWGDLDSLARVARAEIEELAKAPRDGPVPEAKALRRLRAILGHIRGE